MTSTLAELSTAQLAALASAAQRGSLEPPVDLGLGPYCPAPLQQALGKELEQAAAVGIRGSSLAFLLNTLVRDRALREARTPLVDLVWTGPDIPGNPSRDTRIVVHEMFRKAKRSVLVSTYALYDGRTLFDPLHETWQAHPDLMVKLFVDIKHGEMGAPPADTLAKFRHDFKAFHWPWARLPEVYYDPRSLSTDPAVKSCLHAKCVIVDDREVFLTSANLTEAAQQRNIEAGIVVNSEALAARVRDHFMAMVSAKLVLLLFEAAWLSP